LTMGGERTESSSRMKEIKSKMVRGVAGLSIVVFEVGCQTDGRGVVSEWRGRAKAGFDCEENRGEGHNMGMRLKAATMDSSDRRI
jgi:hypothetical protein